uniref:Uncharacterized protein n=1 Tax=Candidatus Kentrum sp. SD TaxID=2126332 RepID=A0A450YQG4_9GAMM|nr:MAG: hypothetical protein BECKSD772F_GA0070984_101436 [Candidatus Kentron sp. SD]VFK43801.1 MAG: hypothetical protein BECKSD772E_GA0070983_102919 [Candidatus Kentron sp. SD]
MSEAHSGVAIIAMDIDDLLTSMEVRDLRSKADQLDPVHHSEKHFFTVKFEHRKRPYEVENVLVPGCIEFFQFLFDQEDVRPAFFSSGIRARNLELGRIVVELAIEAGGSLAWRDRYDVYSREDCFDTERLQHYVTKEEQRKFQPPDFFGNLKKDLRMIHHGRDAYHELYNRTLRDLSVLLPDPVKDAEILTNIILLEEDPSYLFPGQEKNLLLCPTYQHPYPCLVNYRGEDTPIDDPDSWRETFKGANPLFYAAGVLEHALARRRAEGRSLPEILWEEQGHLWFDRERYKERYPTPFFTQGRKVLRRYNAELNFAVAGGKAVP